MTTTSPWSQQASPHVTVAAPPPAHTLPPAPGPVPPPGVPGPAGFQPTRPPRRPWGWIALTLALAVGLAAAVGSTVTYLALRNDHAAAAPSSHQTASPSSAPATPRFSPAQADTAKQHLCHVFDVSVRGDGGKGGFRVEGNLNVPLTLRAMNSMAAVQNALAPAVPPNVASAARKYIGSTYDVTTAAMGDTPTPELNRLTDVSNDAINTLADACGLPH
jgi:cell wall-associated NlpC family hydrolase